MNYYGDFIITFISIYADENWKSNISWHFDKLSDEFSEL